MQPIQPAGTGGVTPNQPRQNVEAAGSMQQSNAASVTMSNTSIKITSVDMQVGQMLGNIDPSLANNQFLKMMIALMIMEALLSNDGGSQQSGQAALKAFEQFASSSSNASFLTIESSTNTVQIQQQSTRLDTVEAVQTMSQASQTSDRPGGQIDTSA